MIAVMAPYPNICTWAAPTLRSGIPGAGNGKGLATTRQCGYIDKHTLVLSGELMIPRSKFSGCTTYARSKLSGGLNIMRIKLGGGVG